MTNYRRGDVVLVIFPNADLKSFRKRPALVLGGDDLDTGLPQTIVAMITSNLDRKGPTRVKIKKNSPAGQQMSLHSDSIVVADNLATVLEREIDRAIGRCPIMDRVDTALRLALGLKSG